MPSFDQPMAREASLEIHRGPFLSIEAIQRLLHLEERDHELIEAQISDVHQRKELVNQILQRLTDPVERLNFPGLPENPEQTLEFVEGQLNRLDEELRVKEEVLTHKAQKFEELEKDPAKKSLKEKAINALKKGWNFTWRHKWKILMVLAVIAGGVAGWYYWETLSGLLGLGGAGNGAGETAAERAAEVAGAAAEGAGEYTIRTFGNSIEYAGETYGVDQIPALMEKLPDTIGSAGESLNILREGTSKAAMEIELKNALIQKYGESLYIEWPGGPRP